MLPSSPHVKKVYTEGIIPTLQKVHASNSGEATICIDSTTLDVDVARQVAQSVIDTGARMIDAPVSGGKSFPDLKYLLCSFADAYCKV
jgi:3-hydroxyisobutyrate dehydrogenase